MGDESLPVQSGENPLPTIGEALAQWLGFQLPTIPMPQAAKNFDKAVGTILLAAGENAVARIKANTGKVKAKGKIDVEGLYRTDEEKRKIENKAAVVQVAVDELNGEAGSQTAQDAKTEIDEDWLNLFSRLAEDKSSDELKALFGRILAGEIRRPGAFSLRTIQFIATLSKADAHEISEFLAFAVSDQFVPMSDNVSFGPHIHARIKMQELGLATHASMIGGLAWSLNVGPETNFVLPGTSNGILIENKSKRALEVQIECQVLTEPGRQLITIANPPPTDLKFLIDLAKILQEKLQSAGLAELLASGEIVVHAGIASMVKPGTYNFRSLHKVPFPQS